MSLRVTDVQEALRHFRDLGHDILSDTKAVHLDGIPYRIPLGHRLNMVTTHNGVSSPTLQSYVAQVEGPLISRIATHGARPLKDGTDIIARNTHAMVPTMYKDSKGSFFDFNANYPEGHHSEISEAPSGSVLWQPFVNNSSLYTDIHEALRSHKEPNSVHKGHVWDYDGVSTPMTSENLRSFNSKKALNTLLSGTPANKGLVVVNHINHGKEWDDITHNKYVYDINSEQLLPHDWESPQ